MFLIFLFDLFLLTLTLTNIFGFLLVNIILSFLFFYFSNFFDMWNNSSTRIACTFFSTSITNPKLWIIFFKLKVLSRKTYVLYHKISLCIRDKMLGSIFEWNKQLSTSHQISNIYDIILFSVYPYLFLDNA